MCNSTEILCVGLRVNAQLANEARVLCLLLICHPHQCLMCVSREGSGHSVHLCIQVLVCIARLCTTYKNPMWCAQVILL